MPLDCPNCGTAIIEDELPRLEAARVLCPQCTEPLPLPEMTMPIALADLPFIRARPELDKTKSYTLQVVSGPEAGKVLQIDKTIVTVGRSACDLIVEDPELSRRHAKVEINGPDATLHDLGSTNGTFVADERISEAPLENSSKFRVGSHEIVFVITERDP